MCGSFQLTNHNVLFQHPWPRGLWAKAFDTSSAGEKEGKRAASAASGPASTSMHLLLADPPALASGFCSPLAGRVVRNRRPPDGTPDGGTGSWQNRVSGMERGGGGGG
ncbi:unnamed protein product [Gadus morhua 'NCC']